MDTNQRKNEVKWALTDLTNQLYPLERHTILVAWWDLLLALSVDRNVLRCVFCVLQKIEFHKIFKMGADREMRYERQFESWFILCMMKIVMLLQQLLWQHIHVKKTKIAYLRIRHIGCTRCNFAYLLSSLQPQIQTQVDSGTQQLFTYFELQSISFMCCE